MVGGHDEAKNPQSDAAMAVVCEKCNRLVTAGRGDLAHYHTHEICAECATKLSAAASKSLPKA